MTGTSTFNNAIGITSTSSSTAAVINESGGTGVGLSIAGNTSQPAAVITQGGGQNAILTGTGTVTVPAYSFAGSASTGLYSPGVNRFALTAGGVNKVNYNGSSVLVSSIYRAAQGGTGGQVVTAGTTATVTFNNATPLTSPDFTGTVYTAPVVGVYLFAVTMTTTVSAVPGLGNILVRRNGGSVVTFSITSVASGAGNIAYGSGTYLLSLTAGDTVDVQLQAVGADFTILGGSPTASSLQFILLWFLSRSGLRNISLPACIKASQGGFFIPFRNNIST